MKKTLEIIYHLIFWIWNLTFLTVVYLGILPLIGIPLIQATFAGIIPVDFFLSLAVLIAVPTVCTIVGAASLRQQPVKLMRLFYGVEAPLLLLCLMRLFLFRELTAASALIIATIGFCIAAFSLELLQGYAKENPAIARLQMAAHSLMLLVALLVGIVLTFYAVPVAWVLLVEFFKFSWLGVIWEMLKLGNISVIWWLPIFFFLFCFSSTLFVAVPPALATLYIHSGRKVLLAFASQYGRNRTLVSSVAVVAVWTILVAALQQQPQIKAFNLLQNPPTTDSDRQALLRQSDTIRSGLLNAYLSSYRYLSTKEENNHIREMYKSVFGLPNGAAKFLQDRYNQLMSPFLYQGKRSDDKKAEKLYAEFFDTPIQKAERQAIEHALQSTYNRDEAKAGLLNINQKKVWLAKQQVTVKPQNDWADIELYEVYENQTSDQQEIFYYFSLPESAVITGLWLGETDNRANRFAFTVSPRGAAQKVYNQEVQRRVDPALLEQVGPRLYRLRAFPIPPKSSGQAQPQKMHLWLTYKVMQQDGKWPLPQLGEKRNIFWTEKTQRIGTPKQDNWLPEFLPASGKHQPQFHQVNFTEGYSISAKPLANSDYSLPKAKRFAVVLDASRSMGSHTKELKETFKWLKENGFADNSFANNDADLYVTGTQPQRFDDIRNFNPAKMTFYGNIQSKQMLQQFAQLRGDTFYDGILLVTDEGSYELSDDSKNIAAIPAPLWMVHLGGQLPPAYDDATLKAIQDSSGGVSVEIPEVMRRLATKAALGTSAVSVVDGYAWYMEKSVPPEASRGGFRNPPLQESVTQSDGFQQIAARLLVLGLSKQTNDKQLIGLDAIHAIAKKFDVVTPYSSMIVLVNDRQKEALKQAEASKDRFDRTVENGKEQLSQPFNPLNVSGVPEPEEWVLIGIGAIALLALGIRQRLVIGNR